ncbi:formyltransferase family protein [Candidatus Parabeggiatoa sp. HSG14]|uniref:methionyl-tRNA formyltransferase n=1 Tax=Candidatus Parabeggiatoa sp. HSG14 TaxID=3055593 RepID=UPI0025A81D0A|nr:formyltransferase family protein [Thiotrichales bacterium HSG14]
MGKKLNILLLAGSNGIPVLREISKTDHKVIAVLAAPEKNTFTTMSSVAKKMGYEVWSAKLVKDPAFAEVIRHLEIDILFSVRTLYIVEENVLEAPRIGAYNLHPSPLPQYAGRNTISWSLYRGETTHGVTVHRMRPKVDTGTIAYQEIFPIEDHDTALSITKKCIRKGIPLLMKLLEDASQDTDNIPQIEQDLTKREYFLKEIPNDGRMLWSQSAKKIVNFVRACDFYPFPSPWGYPRAMYNNRSIQIVKAKKTGKSCQAPPGTIGNFEGSSAIIACADEWVLVETIINGDERIAPIDFLKMGDRLENGI